MKAQDKQSHKKYKGQKIETYVSKKDIARLKKICERSGSDLDSTYKLLKYLLDCFLRVADPQNDENKTPVPYAIEEIFISPKEYSRLKRLTKKKNTSPKFEVQLLIPFGEFINKRTKKLIINEEGMKISDEIQDMFAGNSEWGNSNSEYQTGMHIKNTSDSRSYKTPDDLK